MRQLFEAKDGTILSCSCLHPDGKIKVCIEREKNLFDVDTDSSDITFNLFIKMETFLILVFKDSNRFFWALTHSIISVTEVESDSD